MDVACKLQLGNKKYTQASDREKHGSSRHALESSL
jgi:hypothetical protein